MSSQDPSKLPRLLYVGDVPVEASSHGSALLYRLFEEYPSERLFAVETNLHQSAPERRLPGVVYRCVNVGWSRPLRSRFNHLWSPWLTYRARFQVRAVESQMGGFEPDAVLTVHHGYSWVTASRLAQRRGLPLHLILHDDWNRMAPFLGICRPSLDREFRQIYQIAASRMCVSPYMERSYFERYGVRGTVLFPSRAKDAVCYEQPPVRLKTAASCLTVAYAGNIFTRGFWRALRQMAEALSQVNGRLLLYSPHTIEQARAAGLRTANVECRGFLSSQDLIRELRHEADVLFIPMSFDEVDRANMEINFPSKLTDSTIPGVPLLIYGPDYSSAVRWACENPGVAEVVCQEDSTMLAAALHKLNDPANRWPLGSEALRVGKACFSHSTATASFHKALCLPFHQTQTSSCSPSRTGINGH